MDPFRGDSSLPAMRPNCFLSASSLTPRYCRVAIYAKNLCATLCRLCIVLRSAGCGWFGFAGFTSYEWEVAHLPRERVLAGCWSVATAVAFSTNCAGARKAGSCGENSGNTSRGWCLARCQRGWDAGADGTPAQCYGVATKKAPQQAAGPNASGKFGCRLAFDCF